MTELKLSFFESAGITGSEWSRFYRPELGALAVSIPGESSEVLIGLKQEEGHNLEWSIFGSSIGGEQSPELYDFVRAYLEWSRINREDWRTVLISEIKRMLHHLQGILGYLKLNSVVRTNEYVRLSEDGLYTIEGK